MDGDAVLADGVRMVTTDDIEHAIGQPLRNGDKFTVLASGDALDLIRVEREGTIIFQGKCRIQEGLSEVVLVEDRFAEYEVHDNWGLLRAIGNRTKEG